MPISTYNNRLKRTTHTASASMSWIEIAVLAFIGANAVVISDIPANCSAVGIPAKILYPKNDVVKAKK